MMHFYFSDFDNNLFLNAQPKNNYYNILITYAPSSGCNGGSKTYKLKLTSNDLLKSKRNSDSDTSDNSKTIFKTREKVKAGAIGSFFVKEMDIDFLSVAKWKDSFTGTMISTDT